jgi:hypothetical protein
MDLEVYKKAPTVRFLEISDRRQIALSSNTARSQN